MKYIKCNNKLTRNISTQFLWIIQVIILYIWFKFIQRVKKNLLSFEIDWKENYWHNFYRWSDGQMIVMISNYKKILKGWLEN